MSAQDKKTSQDTPVARVMAPMGVSKNVLIYALNRWPQDHAKFVNGSVSAKDAIAALEKYPHEIIYAGVSLDMEVG